MSLWQTVCREAAGAVRSISYDLGLLKSRRGKPTRRLVIAMGVLTVFATAGTGTVVMVVDALDSPQPADGAPTADRADSDTDTGSEDPSLSGVGGATGSTRLSPSASLTTSPYHSRTPSPGASRSRTPEHSPTDSKSPTQKPTSPSAPSPSCTDPASPSPDCSPPSSPVTGNSLSPTP